MSFAELLDLLADLGRRHLQIGRAYLTATGEAPSSSIYPLLLVETDPLCEVLNMRLDTYSLALQVLDVSRDSSGQRRDGAETAEAVMTRTKDWANEILEQLHAEHPGWIEGSPSFLGLSGFGGTDLATGWRLELKLKVPRDLDRNLNGEKFLPKE